MLIKTGDKDQGCDVDVIKGGRENELPFCKIITNPDKKNILERERMFCAYGRAVSKNMNGTKVKKKERKNSQCSSRN